MNEKLLAHAQLLDKSGQLMAELNERFVMGADSSASSGGGGSAAENSMRLLSERLKSDWVTSDKSQDALAQRAHLAETAMVVSGNDKIRARRLLAGNWQNDKHGAEVARSAFDTAWKAIVNARQDLKRCSLCGGLDHQALHCTAEEDDEIDVGKEEGRLLSPLEDAGTGELEEEEDDEGGEDVPERKMGTPMIQDQRRVTRQLGAPAIAGKAHWNRHAVDSSTPLRRLGRQYRAGKRLVQIDVNEVPVRYIVSALTFTSCSVHHVCAHGILTTPSTSFRITSITICTACTWRRKQRRASRAVISCQQVR